MTNFINSVQLQSRQILSCIVLFITIQNSSAQVIDTTNQVNYDSLYNQEKLLSDTIKQPTLTQAQDNIEVDSTTTPNSGILTENNAQIKEDNGYGIFSMFEGNPGRAGLYSLVVPGLGQAYNKRWWKIPLAIGAEASVILILRNRIQAWNFWDDEYRRVLAGGIPTNQNSTLAGIRDTRNAARQNKDYAWIGLIAVHVIVAADAFVDRHLIEFDVDDDLTIKASPIAPYPGLNLVMTF